MTNQQNKQNNKENQYKTSFDVDSIYNLVQSINNIGQTFGRFRNVLKSNIDGRRKILSKASASRDNPPRPRSVETATRSARERKPLVRATVGKNNTPSILQFLYLRPKLAKTNIEPVKPKLKFQPVKLNNIFNGIMSGLKSLKINSLFKPFSLSKSSRPKIAMKPSNRVIVKRTFLSNQLVVIKPPHLQSELKDTQNDTEVKEKPPLVENEIEESNLDSIEEIKETIES